MPWGRLLVMRPNCPWNSGHCTPIYVFISHVPVPQSSLFPGKFILPPRQGYVSHALIIRWCNSKGILMKCDVKPKWGKLLLHLLCTKVPSTFIKITRHAWFKTREITVVWVMILTFKHYPLSKGWQDMTKWPNWPAAHLDTVSPLFRVCCCVSSSIANHTPKW